MPEPNSSVPPSDLWVPAKKQEQEFLQPRLARIDQLERARGLAERVLTLQNQPGYQEFLKEIEGLHGAALNELVACTEDSASIHTLQGKVQAFKNILDVMRNTENQRDTLAVQLKAAQDEIDHMVGPNGRPIPAKNLWR